MKAVQVPNGVAIVFHHGRNCVRFPIRHGDYNGYEERCGGGTPSLVLEPSGFVKGVAETVPHWSTAHASMAELSNDELARLMLGTNFGRSDEDPFRYIPLDNRSSVIHTHDGLAVYVHLDTFILGAIRSLQERNTVPCYGWLGGFPGKLKQDWADCITRLGGAPQPAQETLPFDADRIEV